MNIYFVSLGCDKNLVDSEMMIASLRKAGHQIIDDEAAADVIVVNTCCFIGDAKEESINTLLEMAEYKGTAVCKLLVAAGCLAQRYHKEIKKEIPEVDVIVGTMGYESLVDAISRGMQEKGTVREYLRDINYLPQPLTDRESMSGGYYAYLKIAEGCDKHCTYCVIPKVRGKYRSVPMNNLLAQAEHLVECGAKELILVAQETTLYGEDLYGRRSLPVLLKKLSAIEELKWIRILYCYPEEITEELVDAVRRLPKVCHYLDIPVQHGSDAVLKRMGRMTDRKEIADTVGMLRKKIPDIALRTTLITGFPGETQEQFEGMEGQVDEDVKEARKNEIMELQQEIAFEKCKSQVGRTLEVMIEGRLPEEGVYIARTYMDAPDVDGYVFLESDWNLMSGDFVTVNIVGAKEYDLIGEPVRE